MSFLKSLNPFRDPREFSDISEEEKGEFLSNDLIERMIKIEQHVSGCFGEKKAYNQTKYYKSLTKEEQLEFKDFLRRKENKKKRFLASFLFLSLTTLVLNMQLTGNTVKNYLGGSFFVLSTGLAVIFLVGFFSFALYLFSEKMRERRFDSHFDVLRRIHAKRQVKKYF